MPRSCAAALPGSRGEAYLQQRGIPLALAQQRGVGYAAPGTWPHTARDWRGGRVVFPHATPDGRLVNLYGRAVGTEEQVPKAKRHDHLPGVKGYFNAAALQVDTGPLWVCKGVFDALALLAASVPRVVAIFGVQGWRWDWVREISALVVALDADTAGQQQWRALARQAALRGKGVAAVPAAAYGGVRMRVRPGRQGSCLSRERQQTLMADRPHLATSQNVAKETLSDLAMGVQRVPQGRFAHATTHCALIPPRLCCGVRVRYAHHCAACALGELSGCLPDRCKCA